MDTATRKVWERFCRRWHWLPPETVDAEIDADEAAVLQLAEALGRAACDAWLDGKLDLC